ncbi:MAG: hypothetical protein ACWA44_15545 [Thiotrichales bacterium]
MTNSVNGYGASPTYYTSSPGGSSTTSGNPYGPQGSSNPFSGLSYSALSGMIGPMLSQMGGGQYPGAYGTGSNSYGTPSQHYHPYSYPQTSQSPLFIQSGGGKGGKKGQGQTIIGGGYGYGSPLFLQSGGGKGGKKGQSNVTILGGYGGTPSYGYGQTGPAHPYHGGYPQPAGNSYGYGHYPAAPQRSPLFIQTGGGKGGKKGQGQVVVGGGYGYGNGSPLFVQSGGGKGGKKGQSQVTVIGGYGSPGYGHGGYGAYPGHYGNYGGSWGGHGGYGGNGGNGDNGNNGGTGNNSNGWGGSYGGGYGSNSWGSNS